MFPQNNAVSFSKWWLVFAVPSRPITAHLNHIIRLKKTLSMPDQRTQFLERTPRKIIGSQHFHRLISSVGVSASWRQRRLKPNWRWWQNGQHCNPISRVLSARENNAIEAKCYLLFTGESQETDIVNETSLFFELVPNKNRGCITAVQIFEMRFQNDNDILCAPILRKMTETTDMRKRFACRGILTAHLLWQFWHSLRKLEQIVIAHGTSAAIRLLTFPGGI